MKKYSAYLLVLYAVISFCFIPSSAKANIITNGDFSTGTLAGWDTNGSVIVTDYSHIPDGYNNTWDLSEWDSNLDGSFALIHNQANLSTTVVVAPGSTLESLSFDYGIAWSQNPYPFQGYFVIMTYGITADGNSHYLSYDEVNVLTSSPNVFTGTYSTSYFRDLGLDYTAFSFELSTYSLGTDLIFGIDNIDMDDAPVPEPSTLLLLGSGLVGIAGFGRKLKKNLDS